jgi:hypothetical protein
MQMAAPRKKKSAKSAGNVNELRDALQDVIGRAPKSISIEFDKKAKGRGKLAVDEERPWSGNIYKYNY